MKNMWESMNDLRFMKTLNACVKCLWHVGLGQEGSDEPNKMFFYKTFLPVLAKAVNVSHSLSHYHTILQLGE